jgi:hypothetical protein
MLVLGGVEFPVIRLKDISTGVVSVPVKVEDHLLGVEGLITVTAGLVGMNATKKSGNDAERLLTGTFSVGAKKMSLSGAVLGMMRRTLTISNLGRDGGCWKSLSSL